jgi:hypothetical protein
MIQVATDSLPGRGRALRYKGIRYAPSDATSTVAPKIDDSVIEFEAGPGRVDIGWEGIEFYTGRGYQGFRDIFRRIAWRS